MDEITLPTKKTLDDIERFGIEFNNGFISMKNLATQNLAMAKKYIVIGEEFDENGNRTSVEFHPNLALYSAAEKDNMLYYFDFLKEISNKFTGIEYKDGLSFYDIMNTRSKLDALISQVFSGIMVG